MVRCRDAGLRFALGGGIWGEKSYWPDARGRRHGRTAEFRAPAAAGHGDRHAKTPAGVPPGAGRRVARNHGCVICRGPRPYMAVTIGDAGSVSNPREVDQMGNRLDRLRCSNCSGSCAPARPQVGTEATCPGGRGAARARRRSSWGFHKRRSISRTTYVIHGGQTGRTTCREARPRRGWASPPAGATAAPAIPRPGGRGPRQNSAERRQRLAGEISLMITKTSPAARRAFSPSRGWRAGLSGRRRGGPLPPASSERRAGPADRESHRSVAG